METTTKVCTKCKIEKSCDNFSKNKTTKDGLQRHCRECVKKYNQENVEKNSQVKKKWRQLNPNNVKEKDKKWKKNNFHKIKKYRQDNSDKIKIYNRQYQKNRRNSDPLYKFICNIRKRLSAYFRVISVNKNTRTKDMLGLDLACFKSYIESKFQEGMTWENYGQWHVDHIKPLSLATTEQEVMELNHYTNLQPLWAVENLKKSNKYEESH